jgi:predicted nucleic acid-binding protein
MRVFLDANILLALANPGSHTRLLVEVLLAYDIECISNAYAVEEARRNLARVKPQFSQALEAFLPQIEMVGRLVSKIEITIKSKDIPIIYGAVAGRATHLLTYDEADFGELMKKNYKGVKVLTPKMLMDELKKMGILN